MVKNGKKERKKESEQKKNKQQKKQERKKGEKKENEERKAGLCEFSSSCAFTYITICSASNTVKITVYLVINFTYHP